MCSNPLKRKKMYNISKNPERLSCHVDYKGHIGTQRAKKVLSLVKIEFLIAKNKRESETSF